MTTAVMGATGRVGRIVVVAMEGRLMETHNRIVAGL
jgi:hypothetical protein